MADSVSRCVRLSRLLFDKSPEQISRRVVCRLTATFLVLLLALQVSLPTALGQGRQSSKYFETPVRLKADGKHINIAKFSSSAHAGPCVADVDCDGVNDLIVGSFSGTFFVFKNTGSNSAPIYTAKGELQAGGEAAKVPVY